MHCGEVGVPSVPWWGCCAEVVAQAGIVPQLPGPGRQAAAVHVARTGRQRGGTGWDVGNGPVPETAGGGRVRVVDGHHEAAGLLREGGPGQLGADVLAAGTHDPAHLCHAQLLLVLDVLAGEPERRYLGDRVVRGSHVAPLSELVIDVVLAADHRAP